MKLRRTARTHKKTSSSDSSSESDLEFKCVKLLANIPFTTLPISSLNLDKELRCNM